MLRTSETKQLGHVRRPEAIRRHWDIGVEVGHRPQTDECGCGSRFADLFSGMPATLLTEIKRTIAVVDASLFGNDWIDSRKALLYVGSLPSSDRVRTMRRGVCKERARHAAATQGWDSSSVKTLDRCELELGMPRLRDGWPASR